MLFSWIPCRVLLFLSCGQLISLYASGSFLYQITINSPEDEKRWNRDRGAVSDPLFVRSGRKHRGRIRVAQIHPLGNLILVSAWRPRVSFTLPARAFARPPRPLAIPFRVETLGVRSLDLHLAHPPPEFSPLRALTTSIHIRTPTRRAARPRGRRRRGWKDRKRSFTHPLRARTVGGHIQDKGST